MRRVIVGCVVSLLAGLATASAGDKDKKLDMPAKIKAAVDARFPGAAIKSVGKETVDGKVIYDIEMIHKLRKCEMDVQEDGIVLEVEREIPIAGLPKAVADAVKAKFPKAKIREVMEVNLVKDNKEKLDHYEMTVLLDSREVEITSSTDGTKIEGPEEEKKK